MTYEALSCSHKVLLPQHSWYPICCLGGGGDCYTLRVGLQLPLNSTYGTFRNVFELLLLNSSIQLNTSPFYLGPYTCIPFISWHLSYFFWIRQILCMLIWLIAFLVNVHFSLNERGGTSNLQISWHCLHWRHARRFWHSSDLIAS